MDKRRSRSRLCKHCRAARTGHSTRLCVLCRPSAPIAERILAAYQLKDTMNIRILRVIGRRSHSPAVVALADDHLVKWSPRDDWTCSCDEATFPDCPHIPAIEEVLDPRVTGEPR
uniref:SWIM-type domain-containing protein n=2 Tax=unclassified Mycobacterium TaxID=2642494 RepID=A0A5Q5BL49_MYCSS